MMIIMISMIGLPMFGYLLVLIVCNVLQMKPSFPDVNTCTHIQEGHSVTIFIISKSTVKHPEKVSIM